MDDGIKEAHENIDAVKQHALILEKTYGETDRYYFEGLEERLVLSNYGITLPFEGITSAYKLKAEITKEQLATITSVRLASYVNYDNFNFDLTKPLYESNDGSVFSLGSFGIAIIGFTQGAILPITIGDMTLNVPIPSEGIFLVIPDENYNNLTNNCVAYITGGTITANKYTQIDNKYLRTPIIDIPDEIGKISEDGGILMLGAKTAKGSGLAVGWNAEAESGGFALVSQAKARGIDSVAIGLNAKATSDYAIGIGWEVDAKGTHAFAIGNLAKTIAHAAMSIGYNTISASPKQLVNG